MLRLTFLTTITGPYKDFGEIGAAALDDLAARREEALAEADRSAILEGVKTLPLHPECRKA